MTPLGLALAMLLLGSPVVTHQGPEVLDLTVLPRPSVTTIPTQPASGGIVVGKTEGVYGALVEGTKHELPVALVLTVTPAECRYGEEIVYEVRVRNTGEAALRLPWHVDSNRFAGRDTDVSSADIEARLVVTLAARGGQTGMLDGPPIRLYGSEGEPGSVRTLRPGHEVVIRAPAVCRAYGGVEDALVKNEATKLSGYAKLFVGGKLQTDYRVAKSAVFELSVFRQ